MPKHTGHLTNYSKQAYQIEVRRSIRDIKANSRGKQYDIFRIKGVTKQLSQAYYISEKRVEKDLMEEYNK